MARKKGNGAGPVAIALGSGKIATAAEWGSSSIDDFHQDCIAKGLTHDLLLPSGRTILATRPPLMEWVVFGQVPEALTKAAFEASGKQPEQALANASFEDVKKLATFVRDVVEWTVVRPRIKADAKGPNEIQPSRVPQQDLMFIMEWVRKGCPGVKVMTAKGAVSVESLVNFRNRKRRKRITRPGRRVQDVRPGAK